jgi:hypothetical protein
MGNMKKSWVDLTPQVGRELGSAHPMPFSRVKHEIYTKESARDGRKFFVFIKK